MLLRSTLLLAIPVLFGACSLNIQDPEEEIRKKIQEKSPWAMAGLEGTWLGDSSYTLQDVKPTLISGANRTVLHIYPDSSWSATDPLKLFAPSSPRGILRMGRDSLWLYLGAEKNLPNKKLSATLRFMGNYLEIFDPAANRHSFFHKAPGIDTATWPLLLTSDLWEWKARRAPNHTLDSLQPSGTFEYLTFSPEKFNREINNQGYASTETGNWALQKKNLTLGGDSPKIYRADLFHKDSLRLWPMLDGRPISPFQLYLRTKEKSSRYLRVNDILGYWRTDTLTVRQETIVMHPGRHYDLEIDTGFTIRTFSNIDTLMRYGSWHADSGWLRLRPALPTGTSTPKSPERFRVNHASANTLLLTAAGADPVPGWRLRMTRIDKSVVMANPLDRFPDADYAHIHIGTDTLRFYHRGNYQAGSLERFELSAAPTGSEWLVLSFNPQSESFLGNQPGFIFRFNHTVGVRKGVYRSLPNLNFVLRATGEATGKKLAGEFTGRVARYADNSTQNPSDSVDILGTFRINRTAAGALRAPLWVLP